MKSTIAGLALCSLLLLATSPGTASAQDAADESGAASERPPILDVHMHALHADRFGPPPQAICAPFEKAPTWDPGEEYGPVLAEASTSCVNSLRSPESDTALIRETVEVMERRNIIAVLGGTPERLAAWRKHAPKRFIPSLEFAVVRDSAITPDSIRRLVERGEIEALGEVLNQYAGVAPTDERMEPYWAVAEELDIPVGIHLGFGPPGITYLGSPGYRARLNSALTLEDVLVAHPGLRVYVMHAGFPLLEDMLAMLHAHPQLYVDVAVVASVETRDRFYRFLRRIVEAGFIDRVMWGSDQMVWPGMIEHSLLAIEEAPFLTEAQKRNILYKNAARFLRLSDEEMARHRTM